MSETPEVLEFTSGKGWVPFLRAGVECWRDLEGREWTRAREGEIFHARITFSRARGMRPLHLVRVEESSNVGRHERRVRRAARELKRRGYA